MAKIFRSLWTYEISSTFEITVRELLSNGLDRCRDVNYYINYVMAIAKCCRNIIINHIIILNQSKRRLKMHTCSRNPWPFLLSRFTLFRIYIILESWSHENFCSESSELQHTSISAIFTGNQFPIISCGVLSAKVSFPLIWNLVKILFILQIFLTLLK